MRFLLSLLAIAAVCASSSNGLPTGLPLDGTPMSGSVGFNNYMMYYFVPSRWGDVTFTTTITGGSPYGAWTYVAYDYQPYDGKSDWSNGAIIGYPATFIAGNVRPNATYYVAIQGIGNSETYSLTAQLSPTQGQPPIELFVNDMPYTAQSVERQYADFYVSIPSNSNVTVEIYPLPTEDGEDAVVDRVKNFKRSAIWVQAMIGDTPRLGRYQWQNSTELSQQWSGTVEADFIRQGSVMGISVTAPYSISFYIRVRTANITADWVDSEDPRVRI